MRLVNQVMLRREVHWVLLTNTILFLPDMIFCTMHCQNTILFKVFNSERWFVRCFTQKVGVVIVERS